MKNRSFLYKISALLILCMIAFVSCSEDLVEDKENTSAPVITDFYPKSGKAGTEVTIKGENLLKVDTAYIGNGLARVKYRVNPSEIVVEITSESKTGKILVSGLFGETESNDVFTVTYVVPSINMSTFPTSGKANDEVLIEGDNMDAVTKVMFGTTEATIVSKNEKELVVKVPYFEENEVDVFLSYNTENGVQQAGTTGKPFTLERPQPTVSDYPTSAETGSTITLTGTNLSLVDKVMFDNYEGQITLKQETSLSVVVPSDYTVTSDNVVIKLVYYGDKELTVTNTFEAVVPLIYFWENRTIYAQDPSTTENFLDIFTGKVHTPCDYEKMYNNIYFYIVINGSGIQFTNPSSGSGQISKFVCGDKLSQGAGSKDVKFRRLNPSNSDQNELITKVKNKTLEIISQDDITAASIANAASSSFRHYGNPATNMYDEGDVILFQQFDSGNIVKVGLLEIVKITSTNPASDNTSSVTFNCYFQKQ